MSASFNQRLADASSNHPFGICLGIDPSPAQLSLVSAHVQTTDRSLRADAIERFGLALVEAATGLAAAIKPQVAWFEHAGHQGLRALERIVDAAREAGILVVIDGKRGDIPHSAAGYAEAWLGEDAASGIRGDALTVNGWIGADSMEAFADVAHSRNCQAYVLVLTSNPGAAALQEQTGADGTEWWELTARSVSRLQLGAVVGATRTHQLSRARDLMPDAPLLVPGIGTQGGQVSDLVALTQIESVTAPPTTLINVSRSALPTTSTSTAEIASHARAKLESLLHETTALYPQHANALGFRG